MNKTNSGANSNTLQICIDVFVQFVAYGITMLYWAPILDWYQIGYMTIAAVMFILILVLSNKEERLYNITLFYYRDRVVRRLSKSFFMATLITAGLMFYQEQTMEFKKCYITFLIISYLFAFIRTLFGQNLSRGLRKKEIPRTVFVGKKPEYNRFRYFLNKTSIQTNLLGYIALNKEDIKESEKDSYLGTIDELEKLIREHNIDQIYILQKKDADLTDVQKYMDLCIEMGVTIRLIVDFYKRRKANSYVSAVGNYPVITYHTVSLNTSEQLIKRFMDIIGGFVGIVLSSPIMLITAILIKLDSKGPVIFKQTRVGQNGRTFKIYKFRSMYIDAEERKKELMAQNEIQGGVMFKMKNDPRITRVGKVIRKLSIDELPQFFNVFLGTMSLVGTRPPTLDEVEKYKTNQWRRISIKPGLTGMWQVNGRSSIQDFDEIVKLDLEYIDNWSLFTDIRIICKTVWVLLARKGAC